jgi:hypothetical protein
MYGAVPVAADDVCQTAGFLKKPATAEVAQPLRDPDVISASNST